MINRKTQFSISTYCAVRRFTPILLAFALGNLSGTSQTAASPLSPIGPFTGTLSESWETYNNFTQPTNPTYLNDPTSIMGGMASISNDFMAIYEPSVGPANFGLVASGTAQAMGQKGMAIDDSFPTPSVTTITFSSPMTKFGAYWAAITSTDGSNIIPATVTVSFFDEFSVLLGPPVNFQYSQPTGALDWHGWSAAPSESFTSLSYSGSGVVIDSLQAVTDVPEPATLSMFALGMAAIAGYTILRRKYG